MDVLVTGGDTDLGRVIAEGFRDAGHNVVIAGARRDELEVAAKELEVESIVLDNTDGAALTAGHERAHIDRVLEIPPRRGEIGCSLYLMSASTPRSSSSRSARCAPSASTRVTGSHWCASCSAARSHPF